MADPTESSSIPLRQQDIEQGAGDQQPDGVKVRSCSPPCETFNCTASFGSLCLSLRKTRGAPPIAFAAPGCCPGRSHRISRASQNSAGTAACLA